MSSTISQTPACSDCEDESDVDCPCQIPLPTPIPTVNPVARVLLAAVYKPSPNTPFKILSECPDVLSIIYEHIRRAWRQTIIPPPECVTRRGKLRKGAQQNQSQEELSRVALCRVDVLRSPFPKPSGLYCNMLPFLSDNLDTIPSEYHDYLDIIQQCYNHTSCAEGEVWYLTIHESKLEPGQPQRRGGLHVEGFLATPAVRELNLPWWYGWGLGSLGPLEDSYFQGGIFHASSVTGSCRMWNAQIPRQGSAVLRVGCDIEHLRGVLGEIVEPVLLAKNELYWFTDATPHECLPCDEGYRQYFRLVTGKISAWWEKHSTPNRLGVQPTCQVLKHDKFAKDPYVGFDTSERSGPAV